MFLIEMDPSRFELETPPCEGGVLPLDYGPVQNAFISQAIPNANKINKTKKATIL